MNKPVRERQMPYDFTYMWSLKNKIKEKTKLKQNHRYREQNDSSQRGGVLGAGCKVEGIKKYKLVMGK